MTRSEYMKFHEDKCKQMIEVTKRKNADYSGASEKDDPFANFRIVEMVGICSVETGFLTRISDKLARIATFAKKKQLLVKDESVEDTLIDMANYCILMAGYLKEQKDLEFLYQPANEDVLPLARLMPLKDLLPGTISITGKKAKK